MRTGDVAGYAAGSRSPDIIIESLMVRDGFYYGLGALVAALLLGLLNSWLALPPLLLGGLFL